MYTHLSSLIHIQSVYIQSCPCKQYNYPHFHQRRYVCTYKQTYVHMKEQGNCIILLVLRINQVTTKPVYNASWWLSKPLVCGGTTWVLLACQCDNHFWSGIKGVPLPGGKEHEGPPRLPPARCLSPLPCDLSYSVALNWVWGQGQPSHDTVEVI